MSAFGAAGWTFAASVLLIVLFAVTLKMRPGAEGDIVNAFACQAVAYLSVLFVILRVHAPEVSIRALIGLRRTHAGIYPVAVVLGAAIGLPANFAYTLIVQHFPSPESSGIVEAFRGADVGKRVAIGLIIVVLGPFLEEVFFRGALFRPMRIRYGARLACVLAGLYFGLAHTAEWQSQLPIVLVGIAVAGVRQWSGALGPAFAMHAAFNAVGLAQLALAPRLDFLDVPKPAWIVVGTVVTAICLFVVYRLGLGTSAARIARQRDVEEV